MQASDPVRLSDDPRLRPVPLLRAALLGLIYLAVLVTFARTPRMSGNVFSRYMTIESIVERHTLAIDASPLRAMSGSPDLIRSNGRLYSDKPPVLPALASLPYAALVQSGVRFSRSPQDFLLANWVLVATLVVPASALAVVGLRLVLQAAPLSPLLADVLSLAFGFTSQLLTYALTFNNHSVAAGLLTLAFPLVFLWPDSAAYSRLRLFLAGLLAATAATIDLPAGAACTAAFGLALLARAPRQAWPYLVGCIPPILLHAILQMAITGSPLPAELTPRVFDFPGSYWNTPEGRWVETVPRWQFALELLFGPQGWLTVTPVLAIGLIALVCMSAKRGDPLRPAALALTAVVALLVGYYAWGVRRTDFAGQSFGTRHLLPLSPLVDAFAVIGLARYRRPWAWGVFALLLAIGSLYAVTGARDPWSRIERRNDPALILVRPLVLYPWTSYQR